MTNPSATRTESASDLQKIYSARFSGQQAYRTHVWQILTHSFFSRWIRPTDTVLDLGCGYGEFSNNIPALTMTGFKVEEKIAKFLPYSMSQGSQPPLWMLRLYLKVPLLWKIAGRQFLVIARRP